MTEYYGGPPPPAYRNPSVRKNWIGTTALGVAVLGLAFSWSVLGGVLLGALAIGMGLGGRGVAKRAEADNRTVATSGVALGVLAVVVSLAIIPVWVRLYREVDVPVYVDCSTRATDQDSARRCADDLQKRVDDLFRGATSSAGSAAAGADS